MEERIVVAKLITGEEVVARKNANGDLIRPCRIVPAPQGLMLLEMPFGKECDMIIFNSAIIGEANPGQAVADAYRQVISPLKVAKPSEMNALAKKSGLFLA